MPRTYPVQSPFNRVAGQPWGPRASDTGNPVSGVVEAATLTLTGTLESAKTESQTVTCTGTFAAGGVANITLNGTSYDYTVLAGDAPTDVAAGLVAAAALDAHYNVATNPGWDYVDISAKVVGPWSGTITSGYTPAGTEDGALVQVQNVAGAAANTFAVSDGTTNFSHAVTTLSHTLNAQAALMANVINADPSYAALAVGPVVYVTAATAAPFTFIDTSINHQTPGGAVVIALGNVTQAGPLQLGSPGVQNLSTYRAVTVWAQVLAGTSFDLTIWFFDVNVGLWVDSAPVTINAAVQIVQPNVAAIGAMFCEMSNFVGGAVGLLSIEGTDTRPGYN